MVWTRGGGPAYTPRPSGGAGGLSRSEARVPIPGPSRTAGPPMAAKKLSSNDLQQFESLLRQMLGVVTGDIQSLESEAFGDGTEKSNVSVEDSGSEISSVELSLELLERDENTVREIMDALDRLRRGTYGECEVCDKPIRKTRLQAMPHARNCIECQRALEQDGL